MRRQWTTPWLRPVEGSVFLHSEENAFSICLAHVLYYFDIPTGAEVRFTVRRPLRSSKPREDEHVISFTKNWNLVVYSSLRRRRQESFTVRALNWMESVAIPAEKVLWLSCEYRTRRTS